MPMYLGTHHSGVGELTRINIHHYGSFINLRPSVIGLTDLWVKEILCGHDEGRKAEVYKAVVDEGRKLFYVALDQGYDPRNNWHSPGRC